MDAQAELDIFYSILIAIGMILIFAIAVVLFFLRYRRGLYKQQVIIERQESEHRLALLKATLEVTELERKRIAEELHDAIGSHLAVTKMSLNALNAEKIETAELQSMIESSKATINDTIHTVRQISHDLYPPGLAQFGLEGTINDLFEKLSRSNTIQFDFDLSNSSQQLEKEIQLILYRITQELITNTLRYAAATHVQLNIDKTENRIDYHYNDDGNGVDLTNPSFKKGLGLINIESRLKVLNGVTELKSAPKQGFHITIKIPINETNI